MHLIIDKSIIITNGLSIIEVSPPARIASAAIFGELIANVPAHFCFLDAEMPASNMKIA